MKEKLQFIVWVIFIIACITVVILMEILTPNDWFITISQLIVIAKMVSGTLMFKYSHHERT